MIRFATDRTVRMAAAVLAAICLAGPALAQRDGLPPPPGMPGPIIRDPATGRIVPAPPVLEMHVCVDLADDPACETTWLQAALDRVTGGGTVVMHPGEYKQAARITTSGLRIAAKPGAALVGVATGGKGALVIPANDTVIEGLSCSGISVRDRNGACIRLEGTNLTLRNVHFFDSEEGLLAGRESGLVVIEDSRFENLGRGGQAHGIYVNGGELIIRRSVFIRSKDQGHEIKSRARRTLVEDCVVASLNGKDSYLIDLPNGGEAVIRRTILHEGRASVNGGAVAFAMARNRPPHENSSLRMEDNVILMDRPRGVTVKTRHGFRAALTGNVIVGKTGRYRLGMVDSKCSEAGNVCVADRTALQALGKLPLPRMPGLGRLLSETGLWRH